MPRTSRLPEVWRLWTSSPPQGKKYTLSELIDVINERLIIQKHVMIRKDAAFVVYPADRQIPSSEVARIVIADLNKRGRTEVVSIIATVLQGNVDEVAPSIKRQMSPFGEVMPIPNSDKLILQDTAAQLKRVLLDNPGTFGQKVAQDADNGADSPALAAETPPLGNQISIHMNANMCWPAMRRSICGSSSEIPNRNWRSKG